MRFEDLGLISPLLRALERAGYQTATPIQAEAIPHLLEGRDIIGAAQTGTGKTAAFALPILQRLTESKSPHARRPIRALVLSPTRELALQIGRSFREYGHFTGLRNTVIYGGVSQQAQVRALKNGVDILVATPGRLVDLMNQGYVRLQHIDTLVLDEADRMLDMGFLADLETIIGAIPPERQTMLFSATMDKTIAELAKDILQDPVHVRVAPVRSTCESIDQSVCFVADAPEKLKLLTEFLQRSEVKRVFVFTRTKHGADRLAQQLARTGIRTDAMHSNKSQAARQRTLERLRNDQITVLVATDVAARGLDVDGVTHVVNYEMPREPEMYIHRIGRTGRAGTSGVAVSYCDPSERKQLQLIERLLGRSLNVAWGSRGAAPGPKGKKSSRRPPWGPAAAKRHRMAGRPAQKGRKARQPARAS